MTDELAAQLAALRAEARRPIPPITDPPGVGRARLAELVDALADAHISEDDQP